MLITVDKGLEQVLDVSEFLSRSAHELCNADLEKYSMKAV
jgi:hypothetical protein